MSDFVPQRAGMSPRRRSRYAPNNQVQRAIQLARAEGLTAAGLKLGSDGSISVFFVATTEKVGVSESREDNPDAALAAWEAKFGFAGR
jgi:hypothetical protein